MIASKIDSSLKYHDHHQLSGTINIGSSINDVTFLGEGCQGLCDANTTVLVLKSMKIGEWGPRKQN